MGNNDRKTPQADRGIFERPRASGIWWVRYADQSGRIHREKVGPKSLARKVYQKRKTEVRESRFFPETIRRREVPLADMIDDYLKRIANTHRSYSECKRYGALWKAALGSRTLREITTGDIERCKARRLTGELKPVDKRKRKPQKDPVVLATVNREMSFLRRVFNVAMQDGLMEVNPVRPRLFAKETNSRVRYLTDEEEARLRKEIGETDWPKIALAIHTGLRRGEEFGLRWENVDFTAGIITIPLSKSGETRRVPMNDTVREILRSLPSRLKTGWVFTSHTGTTPVNAKNFVRRVFEPALKAAQIENFHWHDMRHTFASRLVMLGVDLRTVQELLGHHSYEMTLRYSHLSPRHQLEAVQRLNVTSTTTGTKAPEERIAVEVGTRRPQEAHEKSRASRKAGDRGRTGDVQLGKRFAANSARS